MDSQLRQLERELESTPSGDNALRLLHAYHRMGRSLPAEKLSFFVKLSEHAPELLSEMKLLSENNKLRLAPSHLRRLVVQVRHLVRYTASEAYAAPTLDAARETVKLFFACDVTGLLGQGRGHRCGHHHLTFANAQKCAKRMGQEILRQLLEKDQPKATQILNLELQR